MDSDTKRPSVASGIVEERRRRAAQMQGGEPEPREASQAARLAIPAPMLDIRLRDGRIRSFAYAFLSEMDFIPGDTMTLIFGDKRVTVDGQGLMETRDRIHMHKEDWIQEGTEAEGDLKPAGAAHISRIEIETVEDHKKEKPREGGRSKGIER